MSVKARHFCLSNARGLLAACRASIRVIRLVQTSSRVEVKFPSQDVSSSPRAPGLEPAAKRGNRGETGMWTDAKMSQGDVAANDPLN